MKRTRALTLGVKVGVGVLVCAAVDAEQRLRADAAQIHVVNVHHHTGDHGLVEQSGASDLGKVGKRRNHWVKRLLLYLLLAVMNSCLLYLGQVQERGLSLQRGDKASSDGKFLCCQTFRKVLQRGDQPVFPVFGKVADISQQTGTQTGKHSKNSASEENWCFEKLSRCHDNEVVLVTNLSGISCIVAGIRTSVKT